MTSGTINWLKVRWLIKVNDKRNQHRHRRMMRLPPYVRMCVCADVLAPVEAFSAYYVFVGLWSHSQRQAAAPRLLMVLTRKHGLCVFQSIASDRKFYFESFKCLRSWLRIIFSLSLAPTISLAAIYRYGKSNQDQLTNSTLAPPRYTVYVRWAVRLKELFNWWRLY